jgi:hypothetical protein
MNVQEFEVIMEIATGGDFNDSHKIIEKVNVHLQVGWVLLGIHERGWNSETALLTTVYILGHKNRQAAQYFWDASTKTWIGRIKDSPQIDVPNIPF